MRSAASVAAGARRARHRRAARAHRPRRRDGGCRRGPSPRPRAATPVFLAGAARRRRGGLRRLRRRARARRGRTSTSPCCTAPSARTAPSRGCSSWPACPTWAPACAASAAGMDKELMKALFAAAGLPQAAVPRAARPPPARARRARAARAELGLPLFVKPANLGSSVGVSKVKRAEELDAALDLAFAYDRKVVVEAGVDAREIEVSVLGNESRRPRCPARSSPTASSTTTTRSTRRRAGPSCASRRRSTPRQTARGPEPGRARVPRGGRVRLRARGLPDGPQDGRMLRERDQHHPRLHLHQHVPEAVGGHGPRPTPTCWTGCSTWPRAAPRSGRRLRTRYRAVIVHRGRGAARRAAGARPRRAARRTAQYRAGPRSALRRARASRRWRGWPRRARRTPDDPDRPPTCEALALAWKVEQRPESDRARPRAGAGAWTGPCALADARPARATPQDAARAAARAARPRACAAGIHLFRASSGARPRARPRTCARTCWPRTRPIRRTRTRSSASASTTTTRTCCRALAKLLRFLARMPGGDRERGLAAIEEAGERLAAARTRGAGAALRDLRLLRGATRTARSRRCAGCARRYPGWPLWAPQAGRAPARPHGRSTRRAPRWRARLLEAAERAARPSYRARPPLLARVSLGESLLLDLRPRGGAARAAAGQGRRRRSSPARGRARAPAARAQPRARRRPRRRARPLPSRRRRRRSRGQRKRAQAALRAPIAPPSSRRARSLAAGAPRARSAGAREDAAEAIARGARRLAGVAGGGAAAWRRTTCVHGRAEDAQARSRTWRASDEPQPPWLRPWAWLLRGGSCSTCEGERDARCRRIQEGTAGPVRAGRAARARRGRAAPSASGGTAPSAVSSSI